LALKLGQRKERRGADKESPNQGYSTSWGIEGDPPGTRWKRVTNKHDTEVRGVDVEAKEGKPELGDAI